MLVGLHFGARSILSFYNYVAATKPSRIFFMFWSESFLSHFKQVWNDFGFSFFYSLKFEMLKKSSNWTFVKEEISQTRVLVINLFKGNMVLTGSLCCCCCCCCCSRCLRRKKWFCFWETKNGFLFVVDAIDGLLLTCCLALKSIFGQKRRQQNKGLQQSVSRIWKNLTALVTLASFSLL